MVNSSKKKVAIVKFEERNVLENKEVLIEQKKLIREVIAFLNYHKGPVFGI